MSDDADNEPKLLQGSVTKTVDMPDIEGSFGTNPAGSAAQDCKATTSIGKPGFWGSLVPIWGSGRTAIDDFQNGRWGWGLFNSALAISDVFLIKSIATAGAKLLVKVGTEEGAEIAAKEASEVAAKEAEEQASKLPVSYGEKIEQQIPERGWTKESVEETINNPAKKAITRDTRHLPEGGQMDDPATAFINSDGTYVVRNDVTGDIVQVSNRNDPGWKIPTDWTFLP
jgi:hypothetical protein